MKLKSAVRAIDKKGMLLVYPIKNAPDPASLWSEAYPSEEMRWEWDEEGDDRVADLWHIRAELSRSKKVVYAKWYKGRATFFSRDIFRALLAVLSEARIPLGRDALTLIELLRESSPRSTKELRRESGLQGRLLESTYQKALKELWTRLLIVGFGEVDDGAFPSLAIGATQLLFEDLYLEARELGQAEAWRILAPLRKSPESSRFLRRTLENLRISTH